MSVQVNTLANLTGRIWVAALGAVLIPVYVKMMGVESYALVGIHGTLHTIFGLLDLGLGAGLNRELARLSATGASEEERRDLLATFDVAGICIGVLVAVVVYFLAPLIAYRWVNAHELDRGVIVDAIRMIGVIIGLQMPIGFYHGGINGLERQVLLNGTWIFTSTLRALGAVAALMFIGATVRVYFAWQVCVTVISVTIWGLMLHHLVDGRRGRGRARVSLFKRVWRYSAGWMGNTIGVNALGLTDQVVLSRVLSLKDYGYYTFASYGSQLLMNLIASVSAAFFPRFNQLIAKNDEAGLAAEYRRGYQISATLLVPVSFVVLFFSREVLLLWTRDPVLTNAAATLCAIFAAGMTVFGLSHVAYILALCRGMFRTAIRLTVSLAVVFVPAMILVPRWYGAVGGAAVWAIMTASRGLIVPLLHRRHLRGEGRIWLRQGVIVPFLTAGLVCGVLRLVSPQFSSNLVAAAYLGGTWLVTVAALVAVEPAMRATAAAAFHRLTARTTQ